MKNLKDVQINKKDLLQKAKELKNKVFEIKFQKHTSGIVKPHEFKLLKKEIARMLTTINSAKK